MRSAAAVDVTPAKPLRARIVVPGQKGDRRQCATTGSIGATTQGAARRPRDQKSWFSDRRLTSGTLPMDTKVWTAWGPLGTAPTGTRLSRNCRAPSPQRATPGSAVRAPRSSYVLRRVRGGGPKRSARRGVGAALRTVAAPRAAPTDRGQAETKADAQA